MGSAAVRHWHGRGMAADTGVVSHPGLVFELRLPRSTDGPRPVALCGIDAPITVGAGEVLMCGRLFPPDNQIADVKELRRCRAGSARRTLHLKIHNQPARTIHKSCGRLLSF